MERYEPDVRKEKCPACRGVGFPADPAAQKQDPACKLCEGRGYVVNVRDMNCGRPGFWEKEEIYYCGREACYTAIKGLKTRREARTKWTKITPIDDYRYEGGKPFTPWQKHEDEPDEQYWMRMGSDFMG